MTRRTPRRRGERLRLSASAAAVLLLGAGAAATLRHLAEEVNLSGLPLPLGQAHLIRFLRLLATAAGGRFSLGFVVYSSVALVGLVCAMCVYMLLFRAYHRLRAFYRERRKTLYEPAVLKLVMGAPFEAVEDAFRPRRWGDAEIAQEVLLDAMRHLRGDPFETLARIADRLGFIKRNLKRLRSWSHHARGRAMEALGIMRTPIASAKLIETLHEQPLELKLVALRALAGIRDPAALPYFVKVSDELSPAMLVRLVSLMLEFGPASRETIIELMNRHPAAFPQRIKAEVAREIAAALGPSP